MTIDQIEDLLRTKPGYLKWGPGKLAQHLEADVTRCRKALQQVRKEVSYPKEKTQSENLVLKSRWYNGKEWCESFTNADIDPDPLTKEDWVDIIKDISHLDPIYLESDKLEKNRTLIVWSADKHIGAAIPSDALYKRKYDEHIFHKRMVAIYEKVMDYYHTYGKLDELVLADLGDSLDGFNGFTTRGGHKLPQNLSNKEAARVHFFTHKWFYETLIKANVANKVTIFNVTNDNHAGDFGWHACFGLQQYATIAWPEVNFINQEEFLGHYVVYDKAFVITHGKDKKNRFKGFPIKVNAEVESFIMDYVKDRKIANHEIHVRKGDLHMTDLDCSRHKMSYFNIGSVFGVSDWIMDNFSDGRAACLFELVEEDTSDINTKIMWLS
tara:strand:+ start:164 stop:1309 length:1146 start_codon:yes stop_codon:yes gene_type:complete